MVKKLTWSDVIINEASFSKWGILFQTIVHLTDQSKMGFTSGELKPILKIRVYDPLRILCQKNRIIKLLKLAFILRQHNGKIS